MRLEASLDPTKLDWERYIDPVVCARLEGAAYRSGKTIEEEISHRLQQSLDSQDLTAFDEQIIEAAVKLRGKPTASDNNELLIRKIVRDELANAGIVVPDGQANERPILRSKTPNNNQSSQTESDHTNEG